MLARGQMYPVTEATAFQASLVFSIINNIWLSRGNAHFGLDNRKSALMSKSVKYIR